MDSLGTIPPTMASNGPPKPVVESPVDGVPSVPFPLEDPMETPLPCSWNLCTSGHRWNPIMVLVGCPACGSQLLAVQNTQCPWCNEPCIKTSLRSDFLVKGAGVASRCTGVQPQGDSLDIELTRTSWSTSETTMKTFDQKTLKEDADWAASHLSPVEPR